MAGAEHVGQGRASDRFAYRLPIFAAYMCLFVLSLQGGASSFVTGALLLSIILWKAGLELVGVLRRRNTTPPSQIGLR